MVRLFIKFFSSALFLFLTGCSKGTIREYQIENDISGWFVLVHTENGGNVEERKDKTIVMIRSKRQNIEKGLNFSSWSKELFIQGEKVLNSNPDDAGCVVWGRGSGTITKNGKSIKYSRFFVGKEAEYRTKIYGYRELVSE